MQSKSHAHYICHLAAAWQWSEMLIVVLQVAPASNTRASNSPPCQPPLTGANNSTPRGAPRGAPPGFEQTAAQVRSTSSSYLLR